MRISVARKKIANAETFLQAGSLARQRNAATMCDDVFALEGDAFQTLQERQRYQQFFREEGAPLLAAYRTIEDEDLRRAILHLVRLAAAKKTP